MVYIKHLIYTLLSHVLFNAYDGIGPHRFFSQTHTYVTSYVLPEALFHYQVNTYISGTVCF